MAELRNWLELEEDADGTVGVFARSALLVMEISGLDTGLSDEEIRASAQMGYLIEAMRGE